MNKKLRHHIFMQRPEIDVRKKFLCFSIPKVCRKSVLYHLKKRTLIKTKQRGIHNYTIIFDNLTDDEIKNIFKFTIVRNPWDRVVSTFCYMKQMAADPKIKPKNKKGLLCNGKFIGPEQKFKNFIKKEFKHRSNNEKNLLRLNPHFRYQSTFISFEGKIYVDYVARFETIQKDWSYIAKKIDAGIDLPHINKSVHRHYTQYYDDECIEIVSRAYADDIKMLNYKYGEN